MPRELLEDEILKPTSVSLNPKVMERFDKIVGPDMRSKVIRRLIENYIKDNNNAVVQASK
jgi:metal-responsive CopG/Arc/MetJ family transcriptional regulator